MSLKRINHGNENHTPGFVEDTGDTMTGPLILGGNLGLNNYPISFGGSGYLAPVSVGTTDRVGINGNNLFFPVQAPTVSAPSYVEGGLYYDTTLHKLMIGGATDWETVTSS